MEVCPFVPLIHWDGNQDLRGSARERERASLRAVSSYLPQTGTLCDRCCPAVTQLEPHTILQFDWRPEPANTSSSGGRSHNKPHPVTAGAASHVNASVHEREYTTCLRPPWAILHAYNTWNTSSQSENNNMRDFVIFSLKDN